MRLVMVVPRFPQLPETFIVNKFVGLVDAGWDVHIVCKHEMEKNWQIFQPLKDRPELRRRVHEQWPHTSILIVMLLWLPAFLTTFFKAPRTTWQYWREGWRQFGLKTIKQFYLDAAIIAQAPDILHFEFGTLAVGRTYLKKLLGCCLSVSFRGYDLSYAGLEDPTYYQELWDQVDALHLLGNDLWCRAQTRGCLPDKMHALIPPAIDVNYFTSEQPEREPVEITSERPRLSVWAV
ncbi:MAG: hypothetical protein R3C44_12070 [Chloroflexota bacterium]